MYGTWSGLPGVWGCFRGDLLFGHDRSPFHAGGSVLGTVSRDCGIIAFWKTASIGSKRVAIRIQYSQFPCARYHLTKYFGLWVVKGWKRNDGNWRWDYCCWGRRGDCCRRNQISPFGSWRFVGMPAQFPDPPLKNPDPSCREQFRTYVYEAGDDRAGGNSEV